MKFPITIDRERYSNPFCTPDVVTTVSVYGRRIFYAIVGADQGWFRLFGYGISWKDTRHAHMLFSERTGKRRRYQLGHLRFGFLRPEKAITAQVVQQPAKMVRVETNEFILAEQKEIAKLMKEGYTEAQAKQMRLQATINEHPEVFKEMQAARPLKRGEKRIGSYVRRKKI